MEELLAQVVEEVSLLTTAGDPRRPEIRVVPRPNHAASDSPAQPAPMPETFTADDAGRVSATGHKAVLAYMEHRGVVSRPAEVTSGE